jgi:hypothetical protein
VGSSYLSDPISSIAILPQNRIAVASRAAGGTGRAIILGLDTPNGQQWVLGFPFPVRQLVTHPTIYASNGPPVPQLPAGTRIFGVLDEDACPPPPPAPLTPQPNPDCPGILAVDGLQTRPDGAPNPRFAMRSLDATGSEMVPIRLGTGLISALSVAPTSGHLKAGVPLVGTNGAVKTFDFLGIASTTNGASTTSNGLIYFFDANALSLINISAAPAPVASSLLLVDAGGVTQTYAPGPIQGTASPPPFTGIKLALGAAVSETVSLTFQGAIPGFTNLPVTLIGGETQLPAGTGDPLQLGRLLAGKDRIVVRGADGCSAEVPLSVIQGSLLQTTEPIRCTGAATFSVRAGGDLPGDRPYVVVGTVTGYMGRTGNNQDFAFPAIPQRYGRYYYHPPPDPDHPELVFDPTVPQIQFTMGPGTGIQRDWQYLIVIDSSFAPEYVTVDVNIVGIEFHSPAASAYVGALDQTTDISRLYVAYPSANAILEFPPQLLIPNNPNARNIAAFR